MKDLKFLIDVKKPIANYFEWVIFINPSAKPRTGTYDPPSGSFTAKKMMCGEVLGIEVKGETFKSVQRQIDKERKSSAKFRDKCKTMLIDVKKCDYCSDRFLCFTEK